MKKLLTIFCLLACLTSFGQKKKKAVAPAPKAGTVQTQTKAADSSNIVLVLTKDRALQLLQILDAAKVGLDYGTNGTPLQATQNKELASQLQTAITDGLRQTHPELFQKAQFPPNVDSLQHKK